MIPLWGTNNSPKVGYFKFACQTSCAVHGPMTFPTWWPCWELSASWHLGCHTGLVAKTGGKSLPQTRQLLGLYMHCIVPYCDVQLLRVAAHGCCRCGCSCDWNALRMARRCILLCWDLSFCCVLYWIALFGWTVKNVESYELSGIFGMLVWFCGGGCFISSKHLQTLRSCKRTFLHKSINNRL